MRLLLEIINIATLLLVASFLHDEDLRWVQDGVTATVRDEAGEKITTWYHSEQVIIDPTGFPTFMNNRKYNLRKIEIRPYDNVTITVSEVADGTTATTSTTLQ